MDIFVRPEVDRSGPVIYDSYQRILGPEIEPEIPKWRRWFGDEAYNQINLPTETTPAEAERIRRLYPEARVDILPPNRGGGGFF